MQTKIEHWPLLTFKEYEKDIDPNPNYQRSAVWKTEQKQLLMDSILRRIDIPKIYLREVARNGFSYEIIDGQQRMRALWDFLSNRYCLADEAEDIFVGDTPYQVEGLPYDALPSKLKVERIHKYTLDVVIIQQASEDEIADLFFRLNNGTPLKPAEVRNAMPGKMTLTIREMAHHPFFTKVSFASYRYAHDQVAAQMMLLELSGGPCDIPDRALSRMYSEHEKGVPPAAVARMNEVLNVLDKVFPGSSRLLNRAQTVDLYLLVSYLLSYKKLAKTFFTEFLPWYQQTEAQRQLNNEYRLYMTSAANSRRSLEERFKILLFDFFQSFPASATVNLDPHRLFDDAAKVQLYARDGGVCQSCRKPVGEFEWHADHIVPWIKGGKTEIANGQVLCIKCNLKKKDRLW